MMSSIISQKEISERIAQVRLEVAGPRGKSSFAKALGLSPSTYDYYESTRIPPADVLVRIAELAGVDVNWLITGHTDGRGVPADHPVLQRAAALLADKPDAAAPLAAFVDLLAASLEFPDASDEQTRPAEEPGAPLPDAAGQYSAASAAPLGDPRESWIPILGRSAAGIPQFWADPDQAAGITALDELIERNVGAAVRKVHPATAAAEGQQATVQMITLNAPEGSGVVSFVAAGGIKAIYGDAFALQIDGDSMQPDIRHGDLVILSPSVEAADGKAAVVQLDGQIGVTCKLFRREGHSVHLIPINDQLPPQTYPHDQLIWALRVLARVRSE